MNARAELIEHVGDRKVKYVHVTIEREWFKPGKVIAGTLDEVLPQLDFEYDEGFGSATLFGNVWYTDGTWSERGEYDGFEWWEHKRCPEIPAHAEGVTK